MSSSNSLNSSVESKSLPGYLGNLSEVQEFRLKEAYLALLIAIGGAPPDTKVGVPFPKNVTEQPVKHSRFSLRPSQSVPVEPYSIAECTTELKAALKGLKPTETQEVWRAACRSDHPDSLMLRFLRARKWDTPKALAQFGDTLYWRENGWNIAQLLEQGEEYFITEKPDPGFIEQYKSGKVTLHGHDKQGRPLVFIHVAKHDPKAQSEEAMERYTLNIIENARLCLSQDVNTAAIVFDLSGFGLGNMDYSVVKFILSCFEHYYPECLGYLFIHRAPWVFSSVWAIIKGWIDPVVASKISFTKHEKDLLKFIDSDQIPQSMGGTSSFEYKWIPPVEGESRQVHDKEGKALKNKERNQLYAKFEELTVKWVTAPDSKTSRKYEDERNQVFNEIYDQYWHLDPYVRSRSILDRNGTLGQFKPQLASGGVAQPNL